MNILDYFEGLLFYIHTFGARRSIDVIDPENQPGSGKIRTRSEAYRVRLTPNKYNKN